MSALRGGPARRARPWHARGGWWCFVALVLGVAWWSTPVSNPLDAQALTALQQAWPGRAPRETVAIVFDARSAARLREGQSWGNALSTLLHHLDAAGVKAVWLQAPAELTPQDREAIRAAAGRLPLFVDQVAGHELPTLPLEWQPIDGWDDEATFFGARVRLVDAAIGAIRVPLSIAVGDGPSVIANAWRIGADPSRPMPPFEAPPGLIDVRLGAEIAPRVPIRVATLRDVVSPRLGPAAGLASFDAMNLVFGAAGQPAELVGKTVVIGWDDPRARVQLAGAGDSLAGPQYWALVADAFAAGALVHWVDRSIVAGATTAWLLAAAFFIVAGPLRRAVGAIAGLAVAALAGGLAAYAMAGVFVPLGALWVGLTLLVAGWAVDRLTRSARYFRRQLALLNTQLQRDGVPGSRPAATDSIAVVERAVEQLQSQRAFVLDLVESLPIGVLAADVNGVVRLTNRRARDWLGTDPAASGGTPLLRDVLGTLRGRGGTAAQLLGHSEASCEALARNDRPVWLQYRHIGGALPSIVAIADMSKFKAEAAMKQEALDFLSHDMRAPLSSIAAIVQTPLPDRQPRTIDETLRLIGRLAYRTLDLANEFLAFVRAEETEPVVFEPVFLPDLLESIVDELTPRAHAAGGRLRLEVGAEPVWLHGDAALLARAIRNLVDNAIRHGAGTEVRVSLALRDGQARVGVADAGPGFEPAQLRGTAAKASAHGFGLGLRFVKRVAALHGGAVALANAPGGGAVVTLALPLLAQPPEGAGAQFAPAGSVACD